MITIFLGAPGTGKGTISEKMIEKGYKHISTGNIFRQIMSTDSDLSKELKVIINAGNLVNDELTFKVLVEGLKEFDLKKDKLIFDGYPRTIRQAELLEEFLNKNNLKVNKAINFQIDDEKIIDRIAGRLVCPKCSRVYHEVNKKPKVEGICDFDNEKLVKRKDDSKEEVKHRLVTYYNQTYPLIDFYNKKDLLINLNVDRNINNILEDIERMI